LTLGCDAGDFGPGGAERKRSKAVQSSRLKKFALAAGLSLSFAFACQSFARGPGDGRRTGQAASARRIPAVVVLRARSVARFAGYALDVSFTPNGKVICFDIAADTPRG
jgi:hypothetical protein